MKYRNIAISGDIASGKSTLGRNVATKLGWKFLSMGTFFREWFAFNNISLSKTDQVPESIDRELDERYQKMMQEEWGIVFESHLSGWLSKDIPDILRVLCTARFETRVKRAALRDNVDIAQSRRDLLHRSQNLGEKFKRLYGIEDSFDVNYFDLVVDTTDKSPEESLKIVLDRFKDL